MICVVGLGYVGLPLAVAFGKKEQVFGFDINKNRIEHLQKGIDITGEVSKEDIAHSDILFSSDPEIIAESKFIIIAVPTPIDDTKRPNLNALLSASTLVGKHMKKGTTVVYESTVYPGCTERDCIPVLEKNSNLKWKEDFHVGYSPERINPGDKEHTVDKIIKVVSGCCEKSSKKIAKTYEKIIEAGVHVAPSIKVAEAAKVIENTQRDINIALMNELKQIFDKMNINYQDVLDAAGTKWNFLKFSPGLVGGHCIGVDPYYLAQEATRVGHHPEIVLAGRRINDDMPLYEARRFIQFLSYQGKKIKGTKVLLLGATFKPNVPDTRNSKMQDFARAVSNYGCKVTFCDPFVKEKKIFGYNNVSLKDKNKYDIIVGCVKHKQFEKVKVDYGLF